MTLKRSLFLFSLSVCLPLVAHATPVVTFESSAVVVNATPGASVALNATWSYGRTVVVQTDSDNDGIVRFGQIPKESRMNVVAVDISDGSYAIASFGGPTSEAMPVGLILPAQDGSWSRVTFPAYWKTLLWVRPAAGAWNLYNFDMPDDDETSNNNYYFTQTSAFSSLLGSRPSGFQHGDVLVALSNSSYVVGTVDAQLDAPATPGLISFVNPSDIIEGSIRNVVLMRTTGDSGNVSVRLRTIAGTALPGVDYEPIDSVVTFASGEVLKKVAFHAIDDDVYAGYPRLTFEILEPAGTTISGPTQSPLMITPNDPPPVVGLGSTPASVSETNAPWTLNVPVTLTGKTRVAATVNYSITSFRFQRVEGQITFAVGQTSATIPVSIPGNTISDGDYDVNVSISAFDNATTNSAARSAKITVIDDDLPKAFVDDESVVEDGFNVSLMFHAGGTASASWTTTNGTAVAGTDYTAASGTVKSNSPFITIQIIRDEVPEQPEVFYVDFTNITGATERQRATITIFDHKAMPQVKYSAKEIIEGNTGTTTHVPYTISLAAALPVPLRYEIFIQDKTATSGSDYTANFPQSITFAAGETEKTFFVDVIGDNVDEQEEYFTITAYSPYSIGPGAVRFTIADDDYSVLGSLSVADTSITEGSGSDNYVTFRISLAAPVPEPVRVNYATADITATAGSDYVAKSGMIVFSPGETSLTISVSILGDSLSEADERFAFTLSNPVGATIARATAEATIRDDDSGAQPGLSVIATAPNMSEPAGAGSNAVFRVDLSFSSKDQVTVSYSTANGTAIAGSDFGSTSGTLVFAPGEMTKTVDVPVYGDVAAEPDERFALTISNAIGAAITIDHAEVTIIDDDVPQLLFSDATVGEGNGSLTLTLRIAPFVNKNTTCSWRTTDGTAIAGMDYVAASGSLLFNNQTDIVLQIINDKSAETAETFYVDFFNVTNAVISRQRLEITIADDDQSSPQPALSIAPTTIVEGTDKNTEALFRVTLSFAPTETVRVSFATSSMTAIEGLDFARTTGTLQFAPGELSKTIAVAVFGDSTPESEEGFLMTLSNPSAATIGTASAQATIVDDDPFKRRSIRH